MKRIFDTHAHYDDDAFAKDRQELFEKLPEEGIEKVVNIGTNLETSRFTVQMTEDYVFCYGTVGIHPSDVGEAEKDDGDEIAILATLAKENKKIVAIGEIGLDYHYDDLDKDVQKKWFLRQMEMAKNLKLPIVVHSRDAAMDTVELMRQSHAEEIGGVIHCYSYSKEMAKSFLEMGFYIGIGGVVTFDNAKKIKEVVEYTPTDRIVLETDCPYLAPKPFRGKRNSSLLLPYVVETIAEIKGMSTGEICQKTWENAHSLYRIEQAV